MPTAVETGTGVIVYALPGSGIYGGIKVGFQFVDLLRAHGVGAIVATPGGEAAGWFRSSVPVVPREAIIGRLGPEDTVIFSLPHDHPELSATGAAMVFHCQGTDPLIETVVADEAVTVLTCWRQAADRIEELTGRSPIDVGISVSDVFFGPRTVRDGRSVAVMSRRGRADLLADPGDIDLVTIDDLDEGAVADAMKSACVYAAVSHGEWFGLPALEAMASGCAVVSLPTVGGGDYLDSGHNCEVVEPENMKATILRLLDDGRHRGHLQRNAMITAQRYRRALHSAKVAAALDGELGRVLR